MDSGESITTKGGNTMGEISDVHVKQFTDNFILRSQQQKSRLEPHVRHEDGIVGVSTTVDRVGATAGQKKTSRNSDTPLIKTPFDRRVLFLSDYEWADLLDKEDKKKMITDPTSAVMRSGVAALNRNKDDEIIAALGGNSVAVSEGESANPTFTNVALPATQKVLHGSAGLTLAKLYSAKEILLANEAINEEDPEEEIVFGINAKQLMNLLNTTEVKSSDYNSVKALVDGKLERFLGFSFVRLERFVKDGSDIRYLYAWAKSGLARGLGVDITTRLTERDDKSFAWQPYASMSIGATRTEEEKVVEIQCDES